MKKALKQSLKQPLKKGITGDSGGGSDITLAGLTFEQNVTLSGVTDPNDIWVSPDGTNILLVKIGGSINQVRSYTLSTPFDLSTAGTPSIQSTNGQVYSCMWKPDGTVAFLFDASTTRMEQWTASTPFDISTATESTGDRVLHGGGIGGYWEFKATKNGQYFIRVGASTSPEVFDRYTLSVPWDGSTAALDGNSINLESELAAIGGGTVFGLDFSVNGDYCLVILVGSQTFLVLYRLDTPYDLTTMRKVDEVALPPEVSTPRGCHLNMEERLIFLPDRSIPDDITKFSF